MPPNGFKCKQCGNCCLNLTGAFQACASEADIRRWEEAGRDIWVNPRTGDDVARCPWLRKVPGADKYSCRIHDVKPDHCRRYPVSRKHAERTGCGGFDA